MIHPNQDLIDEYALGRMIGEAQLAVIEEHLPICQKCQDEIEWVDAIRLAFVRPLDAEKV